MTDFIIPEFLSEEQAEGVSQLCQTCLEHDLQKEITAQGKESFLKFVYPSELVQRSRNGSTFILDMKGSHCEGILEANTENHLLLFFVSPQKRKQGLGRQLFNQYRRQFSGSITAYSTAAALPVYLILKFEMKGPAKTLDGITGYPVIFEPDQV